MFLSTSSRDVELVRAALELRDALGELRSFEGFAFAGERAAARGLVELARVVAGDLAAFDVGARSYRKRRAALPPRGLGPATVGRIERALAALARAANRHDEGGTSAQ